MMPRGVIDRESPGRLYPAAHGVLVRVWGSAMYRSAAGIKEKLDRVREGVIK
jgi:hypothetical protein